MRVLSPHARYSIQLFDAGEKVMPGEDGIVHSIATRKAVIANFDKLGLLPHEEEIALAKFGDMFGALPEGVHPLTRVGVFDVEAYCFNAYPNPTERAEAEKMIEDRLRELQPSFPNHFLIVEDPKAPLPWPTYDADSIEDILMIQDRISVDALAVRRYEEENQGREEIIKAMQEKEAKEVVAEPIEVQA